jgi:F0F1-type ATP synthase assembly protein I
MRTGGYSSVRFAIRVLIGQFVITALLAGASGLMRGQRASLSALAGGVIGIVATAYMAFALMRPAASNTASRAAGSFFIGWLVKVVMTITLLVIAFRSKAVEPLFLLVGYAATYLAYWVAAMRSRS